MDFQMKKAIVDSTIVTFADIETTGFSPDKGASIIEIGAVKVDIAEKKIIKKFSSFVHPLYGGRVPPHITELTGITLDDVRGAPEIEYVLEEFYKFIGLYPVSFHNAKFDWTRFLLPAFKLIGKNPANICIDTCEMSRYLHPSLPKHSLSALTNYYGTPIPEDEHHRAIVDCKYSASLYMKMREELINSPETASLFAEETPIFKAPDLFDMQSFKVFRISPWKKGNERRVYVYTSAGVFCFDFIRNVWTIPELRTSNSLNINICSQYILQKFGVATEEELYNRKIA